MGSPPLIGGLCGDHSPHRTTMTQTKRCPIFKFGSWWMQMVDVDVFAPTSSEPLGRWVLTNCDVQVEFGCSAILAQPTQLPVPISLMGVAVQIHAVLEYMDIDSLKFASAPGPFGDRGGMPLMAPWG